MESESNFYHFKKSGVRVRVGMEWIGMELKKWLGVRVGVRVKLILFRQCNSGQILNFFCDYSTVTSWDQSWKSIFMVKIQEWFRYDIIIY